MSTGNVAKSLLLLALAFSAAQPLEARRYRVLHTFKNDITGGYPGPLILDPAGNLLGTTTYGGTVDAGTVFKVDPAGNETVLYSFGNSPAGQYPQGPVILDSAGNLYGAVQDGAAGGSVFKIDSTGNFAVLYTFKGVPDGSTPSEALVQDRVGNLYGTTYLGGAFGLGTIFQLDKHGRETVLHSFAGGRDGANPLGGVIRDSSGDLYGTTLGGGISDLGTIYKLDKTGHETILHSFTGGARGEAPGVGDRKSTRLNS